MLHGCGTIKAIGFSGKGTAMGKICICAMVLCLSTAAGAAELNPVWFDACKYDWGGYDLFQEMALVVIDNRAGAVAKYAGEISLPGNSWSDSWIGTSVGCSPWEGLIDSLCAPAAKDGYEWTMGTCWFTPGSRPYPSAQPVAWRTSLTDPEDVLELWGYVAPGMYWLAVPGTTGTFFHSPAVCGVGGELYYDGNEYPDFTGLPPIPEPAGFLLFAAGLAAALRRGRRAHHKAPRTRQDGP